MNIVKKIWLISSNRIKKFSILYSFVSVTNSLVEIFALVSLLPFLQFVLGKNSNEVDFLNYFNFLKNLNLDIKYGTILFLFLIFTFCIKLIFNFLNLYLNQKIIFEYRKYFPNRLLNKYLTYHYPFFLRNNSSELLKNITSETSMVITGCVAMIIGLISDLTLVFVAVITLLFFDFKSTALVGILLFFLTFLYIFFSKKMIFTSGENRTRLDTLNFQTISNTFDNIKLIKILSRENYFTEFFKNTNNATAKSHLKFNIISSLPRILLEFILVIMVILVAIIALTSPNENVIYLLAIYVATAVRLIPSISKIISASSNLRFNLPALDILYKELFDGDANSNNKIIVKNDIVKLKDKLDFENVTFSHSIKSETILENISLTIEKNDFIGIIGETGSGKSTFVDLLSGLIQPTSGKIIVDNNFVINEENQKVWQKNIGYLSQNITVLDGSIRENIAFGCHESEIDNHKIEKVIELASLSDFVSKRKGGIFSDIGQGGVLMSGGEKQRLAIARTLYFDPEFLILDECTSSLDVHTEFEILNILMKLHSKTIIFITHRNHNLKYCNKIYEVKNKRMTLRLINEVF